MRRVIDGGDDAATARRSLRPRRCRRLVARAAVMLLAGLNASSASTPTSTSTGPCPDEETVMYNCMYGSNLLAAMDCESCLSKAVPTTVNYCHELNVTLQAVPDCPCAPCGYDILTYVSCALHNVTGCVLSDEAVSQEIDQEEPSSSVKCEGLGCALVPSPDKEATGTTVARSNLVACQTERTAYDTCLQSALSTSSSSTSILKASATALACEQCLAGSVPVPGSGATCDDYQAATCSALSDECHSACVDVGCVTELTDYVGCSVTNQLASGCDIRCYTATGTTSNSSDDARNSHQGCSEQVDALTVCLETYEPGTGRVQACPSCLSNAFNGFNVSSISCDALEQDVCPSLQQCDCGSCGDYVAGYFACVAYSTSPSCNGSECNITSTTPTDDGTTNNSTTGGDDGSGGSGGGGDTSPICKSELVSIRQCLLTDELGTGLYDTCPSCINDSFPSGYDASNITCDDMNTVVCRNMKSCDCGSCQYLVGRYYDCVAVMTPASCSQVSYDTCFGFPTGPFPTPPSPPSAPAAVGATPTAYPSASPVPTTPTSPSLMPTVASSSTSSPTRIASDAPVTPGECATKQQTMQTCLRDQLTVSEQDCLTCVDAIDKAIKDPLQNCPSIESTLCTVVSGVCSCGACASDVNAYYTCAAQDTDNCTVSCSVPTQPPASGPGGTSGAVSVARQLGLFCWSGAVAVLWNVAWFL